MDLSFIKQIRVFGSSISVLYVEDEKNIQDQMLKMLKKLFDNVEVASDGVEALALYKASLHDLVITDLKMPNMDGVALCQNIIKINKEQAIILISAYKETDELLELINIGVSGFLLKPIDMDIMLHKIYAIVKNVYSNKMMKYHYEEMKKQLQDGSDTSVDDINDRDALTALYNHKYFLKSVSSDNSMKWAILININDFKLINDYYSYSHGNHLLYQVASVLKIEAQNLGYELFKFSNDEFILLRESAPLDCDDIKNEAQNIYKVLEKKRYTLIGVSDITIGVTLAIAKSKERLLEYLHHTLRYAKNYGLKYAMFKDIPDSTQDMKNIMEIKSMLQNSIEDSSVIPVYQPILMKDKNIKYEVLMRIKNKKDINNLVLPGVFLDIAKKHSYYNEISKMVIFKAFDEMQNNSEVFSLNFSYADMNNKYLMDEIELTITTRALANRLVFEIVETEQLDNLNVVKAFIERFKAHGVKIAIDDFGGGYSNFVYIFTLEPDFIKIDGSLISEILSNEKMFVLVETIIEFAHKLGVEVVAEHVSSKELHDALLELKVDAMQGYYIGHPCETIQEVI